MEFKLEQNRVFLAAWTFYFHRNIERCFGSGLENGDDAFQEYVIRWTVEQAPDA